MPRISKKYLTFLIAFAVILANITSGFAEEMAVQPTVETTLMPRPTEQPLDTQLLESPEAQVVLPEVTPPLPPPPPELTEAEKFAKGLNYQLNASKISYRQLLNNIADTQQSLEMATEQRVALLDQLEMVDKNIENANGKLINVMKQVAEEENILTLIYNEIESKEIAVRYQKNLIRDYIRVLYEQEKQYLSTDEDGKVNALKMLLSDDSVGDNLKDFKYLSLLNETAQQMIDKLDSLDDELLFYREEVKVRRAGLLTLQEIFKKQTDDLELQKESKENLLKVTMGQEQIYAQLLEQTLQEQSESLSEIKALDETVRSIQQKLSEEGNDFDISEYKGFLSSNIKAIYDFQYNQEDKSDVAFSWPVSPSGGISAFFHDEAYRSRFHLDHNAIDIPAMQGSPVRASADGIVYKAKDNNYGYSYIILAHRNGFSTVYGHINSILVEEGQLIKRNSIIGLSGGMPGTKGAGYMTTGPHLHFELLVGGMYTDPLRYLDLTKLPLSFVLNLSDKYTGDWAKKIYVPGLKDRGK